MNIHYVEIIEAYIRFCLRFPYPDIASIYLYVSTIEVIIPREEIHTMYTYTFLYILIIVALIRNIRNKRVELCRLVLSNFPQ